MTPNERILLVEILAETIRIEGLSDRRDFSRDSPGEWVERITAIKDLRDGLGVRIRGDWIGTSPANRQARKRGLAGLKRDGLVTLGATWGCATTHVLLTGEGRALAEAYVSALARLCGKADAVSANVG